MTIAERIADVQFTVDQSGKVTAVVISPELWRELMEALEDVEDRALVEALSSKLRPGPIASGALRWREVADEWW